MSGGKRKKPSIKSVTRFLFIAVCVAGICWVTWSYVLATYSVIFLGQVYTMEELSKPAIETIFGGLIMKVIGNIFEHNDSTVFGKSNNNDNEEY